VQAVYDNSYSSTIDKGDIGKFINSNENLAISRSGANLIVETRPLIDNADTVFLMVNNMTSPNYQLQFKADNFSDPSITASLEDRFTGTSTPVMLNGNITSYDFNVTADAASKATDRFMVVYRSTGVLPVGFTSVQAYQSNSNIAVEWKVATENNIKGYEVEKSGNGRSFTKAASVAATASAGRSQSYNWVDVNAVSGPNYYRIKAVAHNGEEKYSRVVRVNMGAGKGRINVFPNPIVDRTFSLQLNNKEKGTYSVRLLSNAGQVFYSKTILHQGGSATQTLQLENALPKGVYTLEVIGENKAKETIQVINN
jgi:hypothetical protein